MNATHFIEQQLRGVEHDELLTLSHFVVLLGKIVAVAATTRTPPKPTTLARKQRKINEMPHSFGIDKLNFRFRRISEHKRRTSAWARAHTFASPSRACVTACTY